MRRHITNNWRGVSGAPPPRTLTRDAVPYAPFGEGKGREGHRTHHHFYHRRRSEGIPRARRNPCPTRGQGLIEEHDTTFTTTSLASQLPRDDLIHAGDMYSHGTTVSTRGTSLSQP